MILFFLQMIVQISISNECVISKILFYCVQAIDWICDYGEAYLDSHKTVGSNQQETETLLKEHYEFRTRAKVLYFPYYHIVYLHSSVTCCIVFIKVFVFFIL